MKQLFEALPDIKTIVEPLNRSNDLLSMLAHGSTQEAGKTNMQSNNTQSRNQGTNEQKKPLALRDDLEGQKKLSALLLMCFDTLKVYGKEPEQLDNLGNMFQFMLGDYTYVKIEWAMREYLKRNNQLPAPSDIINIIEPPIESKKWCATTFIDIKKRWREGQFITNEEKKYCEDFVSAKIKNPDVITEIDSAIRQVEQQEREYYAF